MKKVLCLISIMMIMVSSFSQTVLPDLSYGDLNSVTSFDIYNSYESKDSTVYFVGDILTIGQPSLPDKKFDYISIASNDPQTAGKAPMVNIAGEKIEIKKIYIVDNNVIVEGRLSSGAGRYLIIFEKAIKSGELNSFDTTMKNNELNRNKIIATNK